MYLFSPTGGLPANGYFGLHRDDITGEVRNSKGMIYDGSISVAAAQDGIVSEVGFNKRWGHFVIIKHQPKLYTFYAYGAHAPEFKKGFRIECGYFIFESAQIGNAKRPHLYFEVRHSKHGKQVDPLIHFFPWPVMPGILDPEQSNLKVDGKLGKKTWKAWQDALKYNQVWYYPGLVDGVPGPITWAAIEKSVEGLWDENSTLPKKKLLIIAIQTKLRGKGFYKGEDTGKFDKETVSALQRALNAAQYK